MRGKTWIAVVAAAVALGAAAAIAMPTGTLSYVPKEEAWRDEHVGYPPVPNGLAAIKRTFGQPCAAEARENTYFFMAHDDKQVYPVHFHRRLGGAASSNLDNDIPGHIERANLGSKLLSGIWGYNCRLKRSGGEYSAHAWGIAVDINSRYESPGSACKTVPSSMGSIWTSHRWSWGASWRDCMHFQYATGY